MYAIVFVCLLVCLLFVRTRHDLFALYMLLTGISFTFYPQFPYIYFIDSFSAARIPIDASGELLLYIWLIEISELHIHCPNIYKCFKLENSIKILKHCIILHYFRELYKSLNIQCHIYTYFCYTPVFEAMIQIFLVISFVFRRLNRLHVSRTRFIQCSACIDHDIAQLLRKQSAKIVSRVHIEQIILIHFSFPF